MRLFSAHLSHEQQKQLLETVREITQKSPLFTPRMPSTGKPFSVRMTNCGPLGWVSDKSGYRYQATHPVTGEPWQPIPSILLDLWQELANYPHPPQACLINYYAPDAKMGLHVDNDEDDFDAPIFSVSLGDEARFRLGGPNRKDPTKSFILRSGDMMLLEGEDRLAHHGIDRIYPDTSSLLKQAGRINITMRRVTKPE